MRTSTRTLLLVALVATACGSVSSSTPAISDQRSGGTPAISDEGSGAVAEAPAVSDLATFFASFADVAQNTDLIVRARATGNTWETPPPGLRPEAERKRRNARTADGEPIDWAMYQWREYEVEEVLQGSYAKLTLNAGDWEDPAVAGNSYVLFGGVMTVDAQGTLFDTESDLGMGPLPYLVVEDGSDIPFDAAVDVPLDNVPFDSLDGDVMVATIRLGHHIPAWITFEDFKAEIGAE